MRGRGEIATWDVMERFRTYGKSRTVIATPYLAQNDISSDGERLLRVKEVEAPKTGLVVVLNWLEELKRLAPTTPGQ